MKKLICALLILTAVTVCYTQVRYTGYSPALTLDRYGRYTGFSLSTETYSPEQAAADGCVVLFELEELANTVLWEQFLTDAAAGRTASVRIAQFYEDFASLTDVIYVGGRYHVFSSDSEFLDDNAYRYLLVLSGRPANAALDSWVAVLTDDPALTFEQVIGSFFSSDSSYLDTLPAFAWVRIGLVKAE